jgi:autoinducer 2-degrading protein
MHIVLVQVTVRPELAEEFEQALLHNARTSVAQDPGCVRFDVSQAKEDPRRWILHEIYTNQEAHAAHREAPHFLAYQSVADRAVVDKQDVWAVGRHIT